MQEGSGFQALEEEDLELEWLALTEGAAEEFNDGDCAAAIDRWRKADELAASLPEYDPRRACTLNNSGVAELLGGEHAAARETFVAALSAWDDAHEWVAHMGLQPRARSSLFHMRMELQHRGRYDAPVRNRHRQALQRGRAVTLTNLAVCLVASGDADDSLATYRDALVAGREAGEDGELLVRFMEASLAVVMETATAPQEAIHYEEFASRAGEHSWLIDLPPVMTDEGRLMAAIRLAVALGAEADE